MNDELVLKIRIQTCNCVSARSGPSCISHHVISCGTKGAAALGSSNTGFGDPNRPGADQVHRLLTTLLDEWQHPAKDLMVLYQERKP